MPPIFIPSMSYLDLDLSQSDKSISIVDVDLEAGFYDEILSTEQENRDDQEATYDYDEMKYLSASLLQVGAKFLLLLTFARFIYIC